MNFVVYFSFGSFYQALKEGATAHLAVFSVPAPKPKDTKGYLLITTDAGIEGGTVHALQVMLLDEAEDSDEALKFASQASDQIKTLLKSKRVKVLEGILSTAGLHESLQHWGHAARYSLASIGKMVGYFKKEGLDERRRNQTVRQSSLVRGKGVSTTRKR